MKGREEVFKDNVDLSAEKFSLLFHVVYDDLKTTRKNKQRLNKFLKGSMALTKKKQRISAISELSQEELNEIPLLAEKYLRSMSNEELSHINIDTALVNKKIDKQQQQHLEKMYKKLVLYQLQHHQHYHKYY